MTSTTVLYFDYIEDVLDLEDEYFQQHGIKLIDGRDPKAIKHYTQVKSLIVTDQKVDKHLLSLMPQLKLIVRHGTGHDRVDVHACSEQGIAVVVIADYCTAEVVEHTLSFIMTIIRKLSLIQSLNDTDLRGPWTSITPVHRLSSYTIGIIGYGQIGRRLTHVLRMLEATVLVNTRTPTKQSTWGEKFVDLATLAQKSDIISIHCKLNSSSHKMINSDFLGQMKSDAWIINTARGAIIEQEALLLALESGHLGGAALDVLDQSRSFPEAALANLENFIYTHHLAWYSVESLLEIRLRIIACVILHAESGQIKEKCINPEILR
jgi:D-3-phosphoglycerate dehydrogenase / 2-oxoglutarate reductase